MRKIILKYGLISGVVVTTMMLIGIGLVKSTQNYDLGMIIGYTSMLIALSVIFVAVKNYRDHELGGTISFGKAFQVGLLITLVAGCIYALGWDIYYRATDSKFMEEYSSHMIEELKKSGASAEKIQAKTQEMEEAKKYYQVTIIRFGMTIMEILPVGILLSLISAAVYRRKTPKTHAI